MQMKDPLSNKLIKNYLHTKMFNISQDSYQYTCQTINIFQIYISRLILNLSIKNTLDSFLSNKIERFSSLVCDWIDSEQKKKKMAAETKSSRSQFSL